MDFYINGKKEHPITADTVKFKEGFIVFKKDDAIVYAISEEFVNTIGTDQYNYSEEYFDDDDFEERMKSDDEIYEIEKKLRAKYS